MKKQFFCLIIPAILFTSAIAKNQPVIAVYQEGKMVHPEKAISDEQVKLIIAKLLGGANDEEKLAIFKAELKDKGVKTDQVMLMLNQFTEDTKIDAATYAYQYTVDYKKYLKLEDIFGTMANKMALKKYVYDHRK